MKQLLILLLLLAPAHAQSGRAQKVQKTVERLLQQSNVGSVGVSIIHLPSKERVDINAERPLALASVFKVPVMLELARQMQTGQSSLTLQTRIPIRHSDKCIGSGSLQHQPDGTAVSVERLVELMETRSDNTATDVLFRRIGLESVDKFMRSHALNSSQIFLTNRAAWLISLAHSTEFRRMSAHQIASRWNQLTVAQRLAAAQRTEKENAGLTLREFQRIEDQSSRDNSHEENVVVATAVDNKASARDLALLLQKLYSGQLLNARWTDYCLGVLGRQSFNTRIPRLLPKSLTVFHKTGTIAGVVNDIGIIEAGPENAIVVVVLVEGVPQGRESAAEVLIGKVAQAAYAAYK